VPKFEGDTVPVSDSSQTNATRPFSVRRRVDSKILRFSLTMGLVGTLLAACILFASAYPGLRRAQRTNEYALSEIDCTGSGCDTSRFTTDSQHQEPDYVVDAATRFFLDVPVFQEEDPIRFVPLDFGDTAFVTTFRQPTSYHTQDGEVWRLYSRQATANGRSIEVIVGYVESAPSKMEPTPPSVIRDVDTELRLEAEKLADNPQALTRGARSPLRLKADGYAILDANTGEVVTWGPWVPMFLPINKKLVAAGRQLYATNSDLYIVQTDVDGRLIATSLVPVINLWWFAAVAVLSFFATSMIARTLSRRFLRNYFAVTSIRLPTLEEACHAGEGQNVEFKRGLSDDETKTREVENELLKSIAAFANTNDGVIFVGVDDRAQIRGLEFNLSQRDRFDRKVRQLVHNHIKPNPAIEVTFEKVRDLAVAKISVARGEAPAYLLNGVIYIRSGSSDVQAQPEDLQRLIAEFAT
jgi:hypothetical protein